MAHVGQKPAFRHVCRFSFHSHPVCSCNGLFKLFINFFQIHLGLLTIGDVIYIAFVAENLAVWSINRTGTVGYPDMRAVFTLNLELEFFHEPSLFKKLPKLTPIFWVYVILICNVGNNGDELFRRCVTEHPGKGWVDINKTTFRRALIKTFDSIFINAPIFFFAFP